MLLRRVSLAVLVLLFSTLPAAAGVGRWTPTGPDGGSVSALAFAPNGRTAYAGTPAGGIFKTVDRGRTWRPSGSIIGEVRDLEVDPFLATTVFAANVQGLWRSTDNGRTWTLLSLPGQLSPADALSVAADPLTPGVIWASLAGPGRVYRSTDHGATWQRVGGGLSRTNAVAPHPQRPGVVYAATADGVYMTTRSGRSWARSGLRGIQVVDLAIDRVETQRLYAATIGTPQTGGPNLKLYVSQNGGNRWTFAGTEVTGLPPIHLVVDPFTAGTAWVSVHLSFRTSVFRTTDGGRSWHSVLEDQGVRSLAADPRRPGVVWAGGDANIINPPSKAALLESMDHGATWEPAGRGIQNHALPQVVADPSAPGLLYTFNYCCNVWRSLDGGATWTEITPTGFDLSGFAELVLDPATPSTFYLTGPYGLFRSQDRGESWAFIRDPFMNALAIDHPSADGPATFYGAAVSEPVILESNDGISFSGLPSSAGLYANTLAVAPATPAAVFANGFNFSPAAGGNLDRVRRSLDGGFTWSTVLELGKADALVTDIVVAPGSPQRLFVSFAEYDRAAGFRGVGGGVYRSIDGGTTWTLSRPGNVIILAVAVSHADPSLVFAAGEAGAAFVSRDGGATWTPISLGLPIHYILDLATDPHAGTTVYAATSGSSLYTYTLP